MSYTALYRKFRPNTFDDVIGQEHIVKTIKNQILSNRLLRRSGSSRSFVVQEEQAKHLLQKYLQELSTVCLQSKAIHAINVNFVVQHWKIEA